MKPLSHDLRKRILGLHLDGESARSIAYALEVDKNTVNNLIGLYRETGDIVPRPHGKGRPPDLDIWGKELLRRLVWQRPDATLQEFTDSYNTIRGTQQGSSTINRHLKALGFTRKKRQSMRSNNNEQMSLRNVKYS